jgi:hypothetical protein
MCYVWDVQAGSSRRKVLYTYESRYLLTDFSSTGKQGAAGWRVNGAPCVAKQLSMFQKLLRSLSEFCKH